MPSYDDNLNGYKKRKKNEIIVKLALQKSDVKITHSSKYKPDSYHPSK